MQLKRDLGYAVKILCTISKKENAGRRASLTLSEISSHTKIARSIVLRICEVLEGEGLLSIDDRAEYSIASESSITMMDVINAFHVQADPFILFDKKFEYSSVSQNDFLSCHKEIENVYKKLVIIPERDNTGI